MRHKGNVENLSAQHTFNCWRLVSANRSDGYGADVEPEGYTGGIPGAYPGPLGVCTGGLFQNTSQRVEGGLFGVQSNDETGQRSPGQVKELAIRPLGQSAE
jgi:hypothetical protein